MERVSKIYGIIYFYINIVTTQEFSILGNSVVFKER